MKRAKWLFPSLVYNLSMIATVITTSLDGIWVPWFTGKLKERKIRGQKLIKVASAVFVNGRIFTGFFYIVVGFLIAQYKQVLFRRKSSVFLVFIAVSICGKIATEGLQERCFLASLAVSVFCFILISKVPDCKCWHTCRNLSTKIYLLHMIVYSFLDIVILGDRYANGLKCFVITMIGTIILSFGLIYFEKKSKVIEKLF